MRSMIVAKAHISKEHVLDHASMLTGLAIRVRCLSRGSSLPSIIEKGDLGSFCICPGDLGRISPYILIFGCLLCWPFACDLGAGV